jgi:GT2 family glycosyltransferase
MKKAALICVTRNNAEKLQTTLNSIIQNTKTEDYDLIIIDNASNDATLGIYQQRVLADHITVVRSGKNLNWVGGINLGLEMTRGYQYVGFLNDDTEVCPNWLENFFDVLDSNPSVAAVGPISSNDIDWQGYDNIRLKFPQWEYPELTKIVRNDLAEMHAKLKNNGVGCTISDSLSFFCVVLRRSAVATVGLLDPAFSEVDCGYNEDFCERLRRFNYQIGLSTKTYIAQFPGKSSFITNEKKIVASKILEEKRKFFLQIKSSAGPLPKEGSFASQVNRLKANSNRKAIAVYLDSGNRAAVEFSWLLKTYKLWNLQLEYDLIVYHNPAVQPPQGDGVVARPLCPMVVEDGFWGDYPFVNSFAMFRQQAEREWLLDRYDYLLKTDCDVFLTANLRGLKSNQVLIGYGAYMPHSHAGIEVAKNMSRIFKNLCIPDHGLNHVGASIFGRVQQVLPVVADHFAITRHLLETEWINGQTGPWPGWHRGVASMYAIHLAVNKNLQANEVRLNALDSFCVDNKITRDVVHIHAWQCDIPWSKLAFFRGEYSEWKVDFEEAFLNAANYCQWVANLSFDQVEIIREKIRLGEVSLNYGLSED